MPKKTKPRCTNCGDETVFPANGDGSRAKLGWCVSCWRTYSKTHITAVRKGQTVDLWADGKGYRRAHGPSRPYYEN